MVINRILGSKRIDFQRSYDFIMLLDALKS